MNRTSLRLSAAAAALALGFLGMGAPAFAVPPVPAPTGPTSLVDPNAGVQLDIHKYMGTPTSPAVPNNGTAQSVTGKDPLQGVRFDVYKVFLGAGTGVAARTNPVDLATNAGWAAAALVTGRVLTQADVVAGQFTIGATTYYLGTLGVASAVTTDGTGTAIFNQGTGGVGLYLVNENIAASGTITNVTTGVVVTKTQVSSSYPFFVTLPMTNPVVLNTWMYEVNVYPKNQVDFATKTVTDAGTQTALDGTGKGGSHTITFTITSSITDGMTATQMAQYVITDVLDPRLSSPVVTVQINSLGTPLGTLTTLTPVTDYTLVTTATSVKVSMTPAGLAKMVTANTAAAAATVVTTISATVNTEGTGTIANQAFVMPNQAWFDANLANCPTCNPGTPTNADPAFPNGVPTKTYYGDLVITKQAAVTGLPLLGAEFAVYLDPTPALGAATNTCVASDVTGTVIATGTSDATGKVTIPGLETSDFYNGAPQTNLQYYCLVETKAPTGYNLNPQAVSFSILQATATASVPALVPVTVNDQLANLGNSLPLTGGEGVTALSIGGVLLVGGGLAYYLVTSRRRRHNAS